MMRLNLTPSESSLLGKQAGDPGSVYCSLGPPTDASVCGIYLHNHGTVVLVLNFFNQIAN